MVDVQLCRRLLLYVTNAVALSVIDVQLCRTVQHDVGFSRRHLVDLWSVIVMVLGDVCAGFGSCLLTSAKSVTDLGQVIPSYTQLQIDDSGDLFINYYTNSTSQSADCMDHGTSTTVRFRCPRRQLVSLTCVEVSVTLLV